MKDRLGRDPVENQKKINQEVARERDHALQNLSVNQAMMKRLEDENQRLHSITDEIPQLEKEIAELRYEKESYRQNLNEASKHISELTGVKAKYTALLGAYKDTREELEILKAQLSSRKIRQENVSKSLRNILEVNIQSLEDGD